MKVIYGVGQVKEDAYHSVWAIGVYDGVHLGHQRLITKAVERARMLEVKSAVMTFHPHPGNVLHPDHKIPYIVPFEYRLKLLEDLGVDICLVIRFTKRFSELSTQKFMKTYLSTRLKPKEVYVGDDFRFGQNREGTLNYFQKNAAEYGFKVYGVKHLHARANRRKISSSDIRRFIAQGDLLKTKRYLGRNYSVVGRVEQGQGRGRLLGFPTANISPKGQLLPPRGVYAVKVRVDKQFYFGMANLGSCPTFNNDIKDVHLETYIFDYEQNILHKEIIVEFIRKVRDEEKFNDKEDLVNQIVNDERVIRKILDKK